MYYDTRHSQSREASVFLNGEKQENVFAADDEAGYIIKGKRQEGTKMLQAAIFVKDTDWPYTLIYNDIVVEVLTGKVEVRFEEPDVKPGEDPERL